MMNKKILLPVMVAALAVTSMPVNWSGPNSYNIVKAEEKLLTKTVDGMVIENGILKRYEGNAADIVIPEGVISVGEYAFQYKDCIKSVTIPESVKEIGNYAFGKCPNLESVKIQGAIDLIDINAFFQCEKLSVIDLSNVKKIGGSAFYNCKSLKEIHLNAIEDIGGNVFCHSGVEKAELNFITENGLIGNGAFRECENLKELVVTGKLSQIKNEAFLGCKALKSIQIEDSSNITYIGERVFEKTPWLTEQCNQSENKMLIINNILVKYQPNVFYAGEYEGKPYEELSYDEEIGKIKEVNFTYTAPVNAEMEKVTIPGNVKAIAGYAFYGAYSVKEIVFDSQIKNIEIGEAAFDFTTWEQEYLEKEDFLVIGGNLVKANYNAEVLEVPNGVKKILKHAFMSDCNSGKVPEKEIVQVKELIIPKSVEIVETWTFTPLRTDTSWHLEKITVPTVFKENCGSCDAFKVVVENVNTSIDAKDLLEGYKTENTLSPTETTIQSPTPTIPVTQLPSPTVPVTQPPSPTVPVTQAPSPTVLVTQAPSSTVPATQVPSPTVPATQVPSPTVPATQTPSPTIIATQAPVPTMPAAQSPMPATTQPATTPNVSTPKPVVKVKRAVIAKAKRLSNTKIKIYMKKTEKVKGYQILVSTDKKFRKNLKRATTSSQSVVLKNLKKRKTYYIKVRAYKLNTEKQKVYGKYSIVKKVKK